jgi:MFS family permease
MNLDFSTSPNEPPDTDRPASSSPTEQQLQTEMPGGHELAGHDPYEALRSKEYRRYVTGSTLLSLGQQMQAAAVGWEVSHRYDVTHKALALSIVGLVGAVPTILLALPAGHMADVFDRRRLTISTVLLMALCSIGLAVVSFLHGSTMFMYLFLLLAATAGATGGPAKSALLPQIVPRELFNNATTWSSSFFQIAAMAGPALGGFIIAIEWITAGHTRIPTLPFVYLLDASFSATFVILLMTVAVRPIERDAAGEHPSVGLMKTLLAGIRFVKFNEIILATITLDLFAVLLGGATYLLPIFATDVLHVGAVGFGWLRAAPAIGAFVMALSLAHLPPMKHAGRNLLLAVAGFGAATIVFGLSKSFPLSLVMLLLTGAFDNISVVVRHTLEQVLTPDDMRGRVSAVTNVFIGASNELGGFESGLTAQIFGPIGSVVGGGIGTIAVVIASALIWPRLRKFGSLKDAQPEQRQ